MIICNRGVPSMSETDLLNKLLQTGRIDRREFLLRSAGLGTALAAGSMFGANRARADEPTSGGRLSLCTGGGRTQEGGGPTAHPGPPETQIGLPPFNRFLGVAEKAQTLSGSVG